MEGQMAAAHTTDFQTDPFLTAASATPFDMTTLLSAAQMLPTSTLQLPPSTCGCCRTPFITSVLMLPDGTTAIYGVYIRVHGHKMVCLSAQSLHSRKICFYMCD